jgi:nucleosome binding factor SPN SPT16 subunit
MSKGGLALSSLVMAVPAGVLFYFSLMSVMRMGESMPTPVMAIAWTLMALSLLLAISPIIFLIAGPKAAVAASGKPAIPPDDLDAAPVAVSRKQPAQQDDDEFAEEDDEQLFDTSEDEAGAEEFEDSFDFDEAEEEEEEPAPKKKKKK